MKKNIGIVGAGNMGSAFYKGLIKVFSEDQIFICDRHSEKLDALQSKNVIKNINAMIPEIDVLMIAVKPQSFADFWNEINVEVKKNFQDKILVSIMAGISIQKIKEMTGVVKIVRAMPNLPAKIQKGMTGWIATAELDIEEKELVRNILSAVGEEIELNTENDIDAITALSGSGPAYFYYVCEVMIEKAMLLGFDENTARKIVETTFYGSAELLHAEKQDAQTLRKNVTSKGGTTEAALQKFSECNVAKIFSEAIDAAKKRAQELNS